MAAVASLVKARRLAKRLERLTESYWELRYEHGQLRARVNRLDPRAAASGAGTETRRSARRDGTLPLLIVERASDSETHTCPRSMTSS